MSHSPHGSVLPDRQGWLQGQQPVVPAVHSKEHREPCAPVAEAQSALLTEDQRLETARTGGADNRKTEAKGTANLLSPPQKLPVPAPRSDTEVQTVPLSPSAPASATVAPQAHPYAFLAPPQQPDEFGRLGLYRVLRVLGTGGMGIVFEAEDTQLQRLVALKVVKPELAAHAVARQRFFREARTAAALTHDHIVTIYQVGEDRGVPFLAMQLLHGESLENRLRQQFQPPEGRPLSLAAAVRIGREIATGLAAAHAHGLIHRDIKPANIWLEADQDRVKILDFGLARLDNDEERVTDPGTIAGTPHYMAPEQADGAPIDCRCDLFSLGCVLYCLCTGDLPFKGAGTLGVLRALALEQPRPPRDLNPAVPPELAALILQLLAKKPSDRPPSARAVADALATIAARLSTDVAIDPDSRTVLCPPEPRSRRRSVWPLRIAVAAIALFLITGGLLMATQLLWVVFQSNRVAEVSLQPKDRVIPIVPARGDRGRRGASWDRRRFGGGWEHSWGRASQGSRHRDSSTELKSEDDPD
jgi:serine/threonine protein kinase